MRDTRPVTSWLTLAPLVAVALVAGCIVERADVSRAPGVETARTVVTTTGAPPVGPYSPAIQVGNTLWVAGQIGRDPETGQLAATTAEQVRYAMDSVGELLEAAGFTFDDIVQTQVYLTDIGDYPELNSVYASYFTGPAPARAVIEASRLPLDARVQIMVTAARATADMP